MKKEFLLILFLALFLVGCSSTQHNVKSPSSLNDQLEDEINGENIDDLLDDFEKQISDDSEWLKDQLDDEINGEDISDMLDDFEKQVSDDSGWLKDQLDSEINGEDIDDILDDFDQRIKDDLDKLDEEVGMDDFNDALDDFKKKIDEDTEWLKDQLDSEINGEDIDDMLDDFEKDVEKTLDELDKKDKFIAVSCDSIKKMSICVDYIGSFWSQQQMEYACKYSGTLSDKPCESGNIGGCEVGRGSFNDMIIWMYPYGGSPISSDAAKSAKPACDMNPMGSWVQ